MIDSDSGHEATENSLRRDTNERPARSGLGRFLGLLAVSLFIASLIILVAVPWIPTDQPPSEPSAAITPANTTGSDEERLPDAPRPVQSTVMLASTPVPAAAEQLQQEAVEVAEELRRRFPDLPEALHVVAMLSAQLRQTVEAEQLWRKCIELSPQHEAYYVNLAAVAMDRGNSELAASTLQQALDAGCASVDVRYHLALALTNLGRCDEALGMIEQALVDSPQSSACWFVLGQAQLKLGKAAEAETSLRKALELGSRSPTVYFSLGNACARQGKHEEAAEFRERFAELKTSEPLDPQQRYQVLSGAETRRIAVMTMVEAATVHSWQGDFLEAERLLLRAIALEPMHADSCRALATLYQNAQMLAEERVVRTRLVEIEPFRFSSYLNLAGVCAQLGEHAAAEAALKQAMAVNPAAVDAYAALAQFHLQAGRASQARWFAQEAVRREPSEEGYRFLASTCRLLGDTAAAEAAMAEARRWAQGPPKQSPVRSKRP
jgi:tetratricopeptide (TPR) repeat protein